MLPVLDTKKLITGSTPPLLAAVDELHRDEPLRVGDERRRQRAGPGGRLLEHAARGLGGAAGGAAVGAHAGEHHVQQHAQAVDVGGGTHRLAAHLLGTGVVRRERALAGGGGVGVGTVERVDFINNVFVNFSYAAMQFGAGFQGAPTTLAGVVIRNNAIFGSGSDNAPL